MNKKHNWLPYILTTLLLGAIALPLNPAEAPAAGTIRGVGTMGYGPSTPGAPPRSSYGNTPGDYRRG